MKIHADKIEVGPPHALRVGDVRRVLRAVPPDWIEGLKEVRLANSLEHSAYAFFSRYDGCLTIYSRRATRAQALAAVLSALAAPSLNIGTAFGCHPSKADKHRLDQAIQPLVDRLLSEITPQGKRGWWGHPDLSAHDRA